MAKKDKGEDLKKKKKKKSSESQDVAVVDVKKKKKKDKSTKLDVSAGSEIATKKKKVEERALLPVEKDDYVLVRVGSRVKLCFAHDPKRKTAYVEDTMHGDDPQTVEYDGHTLIANLGKNPVPGKAFGVDIEPRLGEVMTEMGPMHIYRVLEDDDKKAIRVAVKKIVAKVSEAGLDAVLPIGHIEVRPPRGKWAGSYHITFKTGEAIDHIKLVPKFLNDQIYNQYIFAHEIGHGVWFKLVNEKQRSAWLELYNNSTKVEKAKKTQMEELCQALVKSQLSVREFMRDCEEEEVKLFREALAYLKKHHKMSPEDVNVLLNNNSKMLAEIWPTTASISSTDTLVSEYATTNVAELFAESFAFYLTGKVLPKSVAKLLDKTLKQAQTGE